LVNERQERNQDLIVSRKDIGPQVVVDRSSKFEFVGVQQLLLLCMPFMTVAKQPLLHDVVIDDRIKDYEPMAMMFGI
jgi:hypothetical protein